MKNISEQKSKEEELRAKIEQFKIILDSVPAYIFYKDKEGRYVWVNKALCKATGIPEEKWIGKTVLEVFPKVGESHHRDDREVFESGLPKRNIIEPFETHKGIRWAQEDKVPYRDMNGNLIGVIGMGFDITELQIKRKNLEEANIALNLLLKKREEDKIELEENILLNIKKLVTPYIEKLKNNRLDESQKAFVEILEKNLEEIISPFTQRLSSSYLNFTPAEINAANLIKYGKTTKEIAALLNLSTKTIEVHRKNIRRKMNLRNKSANLRTHLSCI